MKKITFAPHGIEIHMNREHFTEIAKARSVPGPRPSPSAKTKRGNRAQAGIRSVVDVYISLCDRSGRKTDLSLPVLETGPGTPGRCHVRAR